VLNGPEAVGSPGALTWPGLLAARPTRPTAPLGRCWERRTIDLGKSAPTLAALQRQIAHRDCAWRLANATIHICLRDGPGADPPPGP
jgi:hypothetical protein